MLAQRYCLPWICLVNGVLHPCPADLSGPYIPALLDIPPIVIDVQVRAPVRGRVRSGIRVVGPPVLCPGSVKVERNGPSDVAICEIIGMHVLVPTDLH